MPIVHQILLILRLHGLIRSLLRPGLLATLLLHPGGCSPFLSGSSLEIDVVLDGQISLAAQFVPLVTIVSIPNPVQAAINLTFAAIPRCPGKIL
jgi:hypothetical protein